MQDLLHLYGYVPYYTLGNAPGSCAALYLPIEQIRTDEQRFQNRLDAYSAASADRVAQSFDPNLFDPIVVWQDPRDGHTYVLSGHSRLQGMRQRGAATIAVRYFQGDESQAIQFARVEANRAATAENLVEDVAAFKLMRDGDPARGIAAKKEVELKQLFRSKYNKLRAWSHLHRTGKFMAALSQESLSEYPYLEQRAQLVGRLREQNPQLTNVHEDDIFNYLYGSTWGVKTPVDKLEALILKRLDQGYPRLFPECEGLECEPLKELEDFGPAKEVRGVIKALSEQIRTIRERLRSTSPTLRVYTPTEKQALRDIATRWEQDLDILKREAGYLEERQGLFGMRYPLPENIVNTLHGSKAKFKFEPGYSYVDQMKLKFNRKIKLGTIEGTYSVPEVLRAIWNKNKIELQEHLMALYLDDQDVVVGYQLIAEGTISAVNIDARLLFGPAILAAASSIILAHNHPSGNLEPSDSDILATRNLARGAKMLDLKLLDHIILTADGYTSLKAEGFM